MKIKLVHIMHRMDIGGKENGVVNLCNRIDNNMFQPILCCIEDTGPMANRLNPEVEVVNLNCAEKGALLRLIRLTSLFRKMRPHIVHTHGWGGGVLEGVIAARLGGVPVVINGEHGRLKRSLFHVLSHKFLSLLCDGILSVSESLKLRVVSEIGISSSRITVIKNGIDPDKFNGNYDVEYLKKEILEKFNIQIKQDDLIIGCIGSLKPEKNQLMVLNTLREVINSKDSRRIKVLFIGDGPDHAALANFVQMYNLEKSVIFLGNRDDIPQILSLIDVLALTSQCNHEGLPNVVLEAMSSGVPVISTKSIGSNELISDGKNGFIIDVNDIMALGDKLSFLLRNPQTRDEMGDKARKIVLNSFALQEMVSNYEEYYIGMLKKDLYGIQCKRI